MSRLPMSNEEFERQFAQATKRGERKLQTEPRAESAHYDARHGRVVIELTNGCVFMFPAHLAQGLRNATARELGEIEVMPYGVALRWPKLDADFTVAGLVAGVFGTRAWMAELGRKGGSVTSEAKAAAVRENGKKGGRPRKVG
jgi:hypothetical protein